MKKRIIKRVEVPMSDKDTNNPDNKTPEQLAKEAPGQTDVASQVKQTITSQQQIEMESKQVIIGSPDQVQGDSIIPDIEFMASDEFMKSASKEDLDKIRALTEKDILSDAIVALDLKMPNFLDVMPKDAVYSLRWVNRKYQGEGGSRVEQCRALGFTNARPEDIDSPLSDRMTIMDGAIVSGDLVLMKINKLILYGIFKANMIKANQIHNTKNVHKEAMNAGRQELKQQLAQAGISPSLYQGKLGMYIPDAKELGEL
jgi:hypothetical protein